MREVLEKCPQQLLTLERDFTALKNVVSPFPRITYSEAIEILKDRGTAFNWGDDSRADEEAVLSQAFDRPVFVTHYPADIKAFYMKRDGKDRVWRLPWTYLLLRGTGRLSAAARGKIRWTS